MRNVEIAVLDVDGTPINYELKWDNITDVLQVVVSTDSRYQEGFDEGYETAVDDFRSKLEEM